jgi:hypothetical protein
MDNSQPRRSPHSPHTRTRIAPSRTADAACPSWHLELTTGRRILDQRLAGRRPRPGRRPTHRPMAFRCPCRASGGSVGESAHGPGRSRQLRAGHVDRLVEQLNQPTDRPGRRPPPILDHRLRTPGRILAAHTSVSIHGTEDHLGTPATEPRSPNPGHVVPRAEARESPAGEPAPVLVHGSADPRRCTHRTREVQRASSSARSPTTHPQCLKLAQMGRTPRHRERRHLFSRSLPRAWQTGRGAVFARWTASPVVYSGGHFGPVRRRSRIVGRRRSIRPV